RVCCKLALQCNREGKQKQSIEYFEKWHKHHKALTKVDCQYLKCWIADLANTGQSERAKEISDLAVALVKDDLQADPQILHNHGLILNMVATNIANSGGDLNKAKELSEQAQTFVKDDPQILHNFGMILRLLAANIANNGGDLHKAKELSAQALTCVQKDSLFLANHAMILMKLKQLEEAKVFLLQALAIDDNSAYNNYVYGELLLALGKYDEAANYAEKSIRLDAQDFTGHLLIAKICLKQKKTAKVIALASKLLELYPNDPMQKGNVKALLTAAIAQLNGEDVALG
ncbi:MAG TPA: tetratricopeptide repeat protein, partial [Chlamydiales bacterium]|nr:tetratricopeptide repeat protein [Chlamydiales bacterium]